ncbi:hypothetical protein BHE74_00024570 [Ensete ventricosum]|nr:hypothetical protein BHE74_00024570 [Ensete ventricosum]
MALTTPTIRHLFSPLRHRAPSSNSIPFPSCKPIATPALTCCRARGDVSLSVAFNPSGNFDLSLTGEDEGELSYFARILLRSLCEVQHTRSVPANLWNDSR